MTDQTQQDRPNVANRLEVAEAVRGADFPAATGELVERARRNGASEAAMAALSQLPDRSFASAKEVADAVGGDIPSSGMQGGAPHPGEPQSAQAAPAPLGDPSRGIDPLPGTQD